MSELNEIQQILEASPDELYELIARSSHGSPAWFYAKIRLHYMQQQPEELAILCQVLRARQADRCELTTLTAIAELRLSISRGTPNLSLVQELESAHAHHSAWAAEALIACALAYDVAGLHSQARQWWHQAYEQCVRQNLKRKASTCFHNSVAALSREFPERRLFYEYRHAYQLAFESKDFGTSGIALSNLAREYQLAGALRISLRHATEAMNLLKKTHFGTFQYWMALANRCHILIDLEAFDQAREDFEEIALSSSPETASAFQTLQSLFEAKGQPHRRVESVEKVVDVPTWTERQAAAFSTNLELSLSPVEEKLVEALSDGPKSKYELIEALYNNRGNFFHNDSKLKQAIYRLRKKRPHFILTLGEKYSLQDHVMSEGLERQRG